MFLLSSSIMVSLKIRASLNPFDLNLVSIDSLSASKLLFVNFDLFQKRKNDFSFVSFMEAFNLLSLSSPFPLISIEEIFTFLFLLIFTVKCFENSTPKESIKGFVVISTSVLKNPSSRYFFLI